MKYHQQRPILSRFGMALQPWLLLIITILTSRPNHHQVLGLSYRDVKAFVCCSRSSSRGSTSSTCESERNFDDHAAKLRRNEDLPVAHGIGACECVKKSIPTKAVYLGVDDDDVLLFDKGSDNKADIKISLSSLADKDKFRLGSCSDCSSLGSVCASGTSYIAFRVPVGVSQGSGGGGSSSSSSSASSSDGGGGGTSSSIKSPVPEELERKEGSSFSGGAKFGIVVTVFVIVGIMGLACCYYHHLVRKRLGELQVQQQRQPPPPLVPWNRRYTYLILLLVSWVLWNVVLFHCTLIMVGSADNRKSRYGYGYGIFTIARYDGENIYACGAYSPDTIANFDGGPKASRFFGSFGYIMHTLALLLIVTTEVCCAFHLQQQRIKRFVWWVSRILIIVSLVCSLLIFSIFAMEICSYDEIKCVPGAAGIVAIFNVLFLVALVALSWFVQPPEHPLLSIRRWHAEDKDDDNHCIQDSSFNKRGGAAAPHPPEVPESAFQEMTTKPYVCALEVDPTITAHDETVNDDTEAVAEEEVVPCPLPHDFALPFNNGGATAPPPPQVPESGFQEMMTTKPYDDAVMTVDPIITTIITGHEHTVDDHDTKAVAEEEAVLGPLPQDAALTLEDNGNNNNNGWDSAGSKVSGDGWDSDSEGSNARVNDADVWIAHC